MKRTRGIQEWTIMNNLNKDLNKYNQTTHYHTRISEFFFGNLFLFHPFLLPFLPWSYAGSFPLGQSSFDFLNIWINCPGLSFRTVFRNWNTIFKFLNKLFLWSSVSVCSFLIPFRNERNQRPLLHDHCSWGYHWLPHAHPVPPC